MIVTNEENMRERKLKQWLFSFRGGLGAYLANKSITESAMDSVD